jgi:hypothetical protein
MEGQGREMEVGQVGSGLVRVQVMVVVMGLRLAEMGMAEWWVGRMLVAAQM